MIKLQDEYKKSVTIDALTGLKNRNAYVEDLSKLENITLILLDITEFSSINNLYGINAGDLVLKTMANIIRKRIETIVDVELYKVGVDQFAIVLKNRNAMESYEFAQDIINHIDEKQNKHRSFNQLMTFQVQAGISNKAPYLINSAIALKSVIKDYSKKIGVYDDSLDKTQEIEKNINMIQKVKSSIKNAQIIMMFQPIIDLKSKTIIKYEALIRLKDGDEYISPYFFLELAKKAKLYAQITREVITQSIEAVKSKDIDISINLSIEDVLHEETSSFIIEMLDKNSTLAPKITFELLESEEILDFNALKEFIQKVKNYGCSIAIDDFGSGYSNYNYLLELDVDILKIDGSLIKNIDKSKNNQLVVSSIVEFAKLANIKTVAEFISTQEIESVVKNLGVDYGQGYYFSEPKII
nr:bifunctional diguanylate cyclase/phosphodiesterase [uncultured Sulfurimonas sp.]